MAIKINKNIVIEDTNVALKDLAPINTNLYTLSLSAVSVTTSTSEKTLGTYTIPTTGLYLILVDIPVNYYMAADRELNTYIKKNNSVIVTSVGVVNNAAYTLNRTMELIENLNAGDVITITVKSTAAKQYAVSAGRCQFLRLK